MGWFSKNEEPEPLIVKPYDYVREQQLVEEGDLDAYLQHVGQRPLTPTLQGSIAVLVADILRIMTVTGKDRNEDS